MTVFAQSVRDHTDALLRRLRPDVRRSVQNKRATSPDPVRRETHVRHVLWLHGHRAHQHAYCHVDASLRNYFGLSNFKAVVEKSS